MSADERVQVERPRLDDLLAAEGQQLAGQRRGALAGLACTSVSGAWSGSAGFSASQHQLDVAEDDREQVVEVVRHAAGQPADGLHLLGLPQLLLEAFAAARARARARVMSCITVARHSGSPVSRDGMTKTLQSTRTAAPVFRFSDGALAGPGRRGCAPPAAPARRCHPRSAGGTKSKIDRPSRLWSVVETGQPPPRLVQVEHPAVERREADELGAALDERAQRLVLLLRPLASR